MCPPTIFIGLPRSFWSAWKFLIVYTCLFNANSDLKVITDSHFAADFTCFIWKTTVYIAKFHQTKCGVTYGTV